MTLQTRVQKLLSYLHKFKPRLEEPVLEDAMSPNYLKPTESSTRRARGGRNLSITTTTSTQSNISHLAPDRKRRWSPTQTCKDYRRYFLVRTQTINIHWRSNPVDWTGARGRSVRWFRMMDQPPSSPFGTVYPDHVAREMGDKDDEELAEQYWGMKRRQWEEEDRARAEAEASTGGDVKLAERQPSDRDTDAAQPEER